MRLNSFLGLMLSCLFLYSNPITDLLKKAGDSKKYPKAHLLVVFDSTKVDVQESGLSYVNAHKLIKVLTPQGALKTAFIRFDYDPLSAFVDIQKVVIYRSNGTTEELDMRKVLDYPAPAYMIYWGARQKMIAVGRLEPGDAVEIFMFRKGFTYALLQSSDDDKYIPPMKGHFYDIVEFWNDDPVQVKYYEAAIPLNKKVVYKFYNGDAAVKEFSREGKNVFAFTLKDFFPLTPEPNMVALSDVAPKLLLSTSPDWEAKSIWFYKVNEDYKSFASNPDIDKKVDEILKGAKNEMDSVSRLTHWVADNIRYSGLTMGEGEGYTIHSGAMTFTDRCGVCKDKAGMLVTMLRAAGFKSYAAMTMAGSRIDRIPADQFNHSVTVVKLSDGKYHLLDPTWVPFVRELWSSREQQQNYLMGLPEGADLMETPISAPENHFFKIQCASELLPDGEMQGELTITAEGQADASIRRSFLRTPRTEWNRILEKEMLKISPSIEIVKTDTGKNFYDYSSPMALTVTFKIPGYAIITEDEILFKPVSVAPLFEDGPNSHLHMDTGVKERKYPFRDGCSRLIEISETIKLPAYKDSIYIPVSKAIAGTGADLWGGYLLSGNTLTFEMKASYKKRIYEPADWESFKNTLLSQKKFNEEYIILKVR